MNHSRHLHPFTKAKSSIIWIGIILLLALLPACSPKQLALTPITPTPTENTFPGRFVWSDLLTSNLAISRTFYEQLFGWTFEEQENYTVIFNQGQPIAGMVEMKSDTPKTAYWIGYISVPDVDKAVATVLENNGTILTGPGTMLNRGEYVAIKDPQGASLVLLHSATGDPDQKAVVSGSWLWHELWTDDINSSLAFYTNVLGYTASAVAADDQASDEQNTPGAYQVLNKDDHWCAGITALPFPEIMPQWVPAVRVVDLAAIISRVDKFGGRILIEPSHPLSDGTVALIEDPDGALLMVEVWQSASDQEVEK